jgi:hypothetical protein
VGIGVADACVFLGNLCELRIARQVLLGFFQQNAARDLSSLSSLAIAEMASSRAQRLFSERW